MFLSTQELLQRELNAELQRSGYKGRNFLGAVTNLGKCMYLQNREIYDAMEKPRMSTRLMSGRQKWAKDRCCASPSSVLISLTAVDNMFDAFYPMCVSVLGEENPSKKVELPTCGDKRLLEGGSSRWQD